MLKMLTVIHSTDLEMNFFFIKREEGNERSLTLGGCWGHELELGYWG
jgi:hypothetical protein